MKLSVVLYETTLGEVLLKFTERQRHCRCSTHWPLWQISAVDVFPGSRGDLKGERSDGLRARSESPLVESVGNLTSMLSPSTEIEPRR